MHDPKAFAKQALQAMRTMRYKARSSLSLDQQLCWQQQPTSLLPLHCLYGSRDTPLHPPCDISHRSSPFANKHRVQDRLASHLRHYRPRPLDNYIDHMDYDPADLGYHACGRPTSPNLTEPDYIRKHETSLFRPHCPLTSSPS